MQIFHNKLDTFKGRSIIKNIPYTYKDNTREYLGTTFRDFQEFPALDIVAKHGVTTQNQYFGHSSGVSGNYMVVGVPYAEINNDSDRFDLGLIQIFKLESNKWVFHQEITYTDIGLTVTENEYLGRAVDIDGDSIIIGLPYADTDGGNNGGWCVFDRNTDTDIFELKYRHVLDTSLDVYPYNGWDVSISEQYYVISAMHAEADGAPSDSGRVQIFTRSGDTFSRHSIIDAVTPDGSAYFGRSVDIYKNRLVILESNSDMGYDLDVGHIYIFDNVNGQEWELRSEISTYDVGTYGSQSTKDTYANSENPLSVSIEKDYIVVGQPFDNIITTNVGSAVIYKTFDNVNYEEITRVQPPVQMYGGSDYFGYSVSLSENKLVVGAQRSEQGGAPDAGAVYYYNIDETSESMLRNNDLDRGLIEIRRDEGFISNIEIIDY